MPLTIFFSPTTAARTRSLHCTGDAKRTVRINCIFAVYTVLTLTIFSIYLLFPGPSCDPGYLSSQKDFCPASAVTRFCLLQQSGYVKIMVRIHFVLMILQFVYSPFFQLNSNFWGHRMIRDISAHSWIFAPPSLPPALVYYNRAAT